ncbi:hypothetical protein H312_01147, partial [Anncaliia algerae PRA339]
SFIENISNDRLIFLDETGFNIHTNKTYGYSLKNTPAILESPANKGKKVCLIAAISNKGLLAYETKLGGWNAESFCNFINTKLAPAILNLNIRNNFNYGQLQTSLEHYRKTSVI